MSLKGLNLDERATYLLGLAVRRQIQQAPADPDTQREIGAVMRWVEHWLTADEHMVITEATGCVFDDDAAAEIEQMCAEVESLKRSPEGEDDDMPF